MSFGVAAKAMITSMKNNAITKRKSYFDQKTTNSKSVLRRSPLLDKKATLELLSEY